MALFDRLARCQNKPAQVSLNVAENCSQVEAIAPNTLIRFFSTAAILACYVFIGVSNESLAQQKKATKVSDACTQFDQEMSTLRLVLERQQRIYQGLDELINQGDGHDSSGLLFSVDLDDEDEVQRRVKELTANLAKADEPIVGKPSKCQELNQLKTEVDSLEQRNDRLRLTYLSWDPARRAAHLQPEDTEEALDSAMRTIVSERTEAEQNKQLVSKRAAASEAKALQLKNTVFGQIAGASARLEQVREELAETQVSWLKRIEAQTAQDQQLATKLATYAEELTFDEDLPQSRLVKLYREVAEIWRDLVDQGVKRNRLNLDLDNVPNVPKKPDRLLAKLRKTTAKGEESTAALISDYLATYEATVAEQEQLLANTQLQMTADINRQYALVTQAAKLRAQLLRDAMTGGAYAFDITDEYFKDIYRELRAIPLRFLGLLDERIIGLQVMVGKGLIGIVGLLKDSFALLLAIMLGIGALYGCRRLPRWLDSRKTARVLGSTFVPRRAGRALDRGMERLIPYSSWIVALFLLPLLEFFLIDTVAEDLAELLPILKYYIYYRLFLLIISDCFRFIGRYGVATIPATEPAQIDRTAKLVGLFFLISATLLHLTRLTVGRALVYDHVDTLMSFCGILVAAYGAWRCRGTIASALGDLGDNSMHRKLLNFCLGRFGFLFCLPTFFYVLFQIVTRYLTENLKDLDYAKRLSAKLYRRRVESNLSEKNSKNRDDRHKKAPHLPEEYTRIFSEDPTFDYRRKETAPGQIIIDDDTTPIELEAINKELSEPLKASSPVKWSDGGNQAWSVLSKKLVEWLDDRQDEPSIVIYGDQGIGKSTMLGRVAQKFHDRATVIRLQLSNKITSSDQLNERLRTLFKDAIGTSQTQTDDLSVVADTSQDTETLLAKYDQQGKPTIILVDEAQNLFLGRVNGFQPVKTLVDLTNKKTDNILWILAFNEQSWTFMSGALGPTQYFRSVIRLSPWNDDEIRRLILDRHSKTDLPLRYNRSLFGGSSSRENAATTEEQFFSLLREESLGNPRLALQLWLRSLRYKSNKFLEVNLPERRALGSLSDSADDVLFVWATVVRHGNLSLREATETTNLNLSQASHALKIGLENELLCQRADGRYQVSIDRQYELYDLLKRRNFIYVP